MAVKGAIAKERVIKKIQEAFGSAYVGEFDKKIYLWSEENGERVQIALTLTCPKTPVGEATQGFAAEPGNSLNFENMSAAPATPKVSEPIEVTEQEQENIKTLLEKLGL